MEVNGKSLAQSSHAEVIAYIHKVNYFFILGIPPYSCFCTLFIIGSYYVMAYTRPYVCLSVHPLNFGVHSIPP